MFCAAGIEPPKVKPLVSLLHPPNLNLASPTLPPKSVPFPVLAMFTYSISETLPPNLYALILLPAPAPPEVVLEKVSPKSVKFPVVANSLKSILFTIVGVLPPYIIPLVLFEVLPLVSSPLATVKSP